ncbi:hypothetical protein BC628DRAFT_250918 [Trametes gibbosa]|nr:hypothetical protein BC628DRAFT_250918 [Trametes gibbosa]
MLVAQASRSVGGASRCHSGAESKSSSSLIAVPNQSRTPAPASFFCYLPWLIGALHQCRPTRGSRKTAPGDPAKHDGQISDLRLEPPSTRRTHGAAEFFCTQSLPSRRRQPECSGGMGRYDGMALCPVDGHPQLDGGQRLRRGGYLSLGLTSCRWLLHSLLLVWG